MSSEAEPSVNDSRAEEAGYSSTSLPTANSELETTNHNFGTTYAGVANPDVVDVFGVDKKSGEILLVMNEPRPWSGGHEQLHELQEKFNAYASFIIDGEMLAAHPELAGKPARIELRCRHIPSEEAVELLEAIHDQLELQAIKMEVVVRGDPRAVGAQNLRSLFVLRRG